MESGFLSGPHVDFQDAVSSQGRKAQGSQAWDVGEGLGEPWESSSDSNGGWGRRSPRSLGAGEAELGPQRNPVVLSNVGPWMPGI